MRQWKIQNIVNQYQQKRLLTGVNWFLNESTKAQTKEKGILCFLLCEKDT